MHAHVEYGKREGPPKTASREEVDARSTGMTFSFHLRRFSFLDYVRGRVESDLKLRSMSARLFAYISRQEY